jgi:hypothetical protein
MGPICEVCANFRSPGAASDPDRIVRVELDQRPVLLCRGHARIAENSGVRTFDELRALYGDGRRSHIPRRRPADLQPDGAGRRSGRRATDLRP